MIEATTDTGYRQIIGTETDTYYFTASYLAAPQPVLLSPELPRTRRGHKITIPVNAPRSRPVHRYYSGFV